MDGFNIALHTIFATPAVFYAMAGVAWGIVGGALPGLSASITMALLLPFTFGMDPTMAIITARLDLCRRRVWRVDPRHPHPHPGHQCGDNDGARRL